MKNKQAEKQAFFDLYKKAKEELEDTKLMLEDSSLDEEMREMAKEELNQLNEDIESTSMQ